MDKDKTSRKRLASAILMVLAGTLLANCSAPAPPPRPDPQDAEPDAVAKSLIDATRTICIPYAVETAGIGTLVRRDDVRKWVGDVHGKNVTRYVINAPGEPVVTPTDTSCIITTARTPLEMDFVRSVYQRYRNTLVLNGYIIRPPPPRDDPQLNIPGVYPPTTLGVACVLGRNPAVITTANPDFVPTAMLTNPQAEAHLDVEILFDARADGCR